MIKELIIWTNGTGSNFTPEQIKQLHSWILRDWQFQPNYWSLVMLAAGLVIVWYGSKKQCA